MATLTLAAADAILKEVYEKALQDQMQSEVTALKRIATTSAGVSSDLQGRYVVFPLRTSRNWGIGSRNEMEALPVPKTNKYAAARVQLSYLYGGCQLSGQTLKLANTDEQAFVNALSQELTGLRETLGKDLGRQFYGTAIGKLATANAAGTTTTFVCSNAEAIYLEADMYVDCYTSADALRNTNSQITLVAKDTPSAGSTTVTFTPAATATASGDYLVITGSRARESIGIRQIISTTGVLYNVDPAVVTQWKATVNSNGGTLRPISEGLMIQLADDVRTLGGGQPTVGFCSLGVRRQYFNLLSQQRQIVNTQKFEGGFEGLAFTTDKGDIPIVSDLQCPWNSLFFVNEKQLKIYQAGDWAFMDMDGSRWQRVIDTNGNYDAYQTFMYRYYQIGTHRRNAHGLLSDITQ
jgi:hypothetical protein